MKCVVKKLIKILGPMKCRDNYNSGPKFFHFCGLYFNSYFVLPHSQTFHLDPVEGQMNGFYPFDQ